MDVENKVPPEVFVVFVKVMAQLLPGHEDDELYAETVTGYFCSIFGAFMLRHPEWMASWMRLIAQEVTLPNEMAEAIDRMVERIGTPDYVSSLFTDEDHE